MRLSICFQVSTLHPISLSLDETPAASAHLKVLDVFLLQSMVLFMQASPYIAALWCGASHPKPSCFVTERITPGERTRHFAQVAALETPGTCAFKSLKWR
jgi:hypothetical protein